MSQIKLLIDVISDMRHLADSLETYAGAVTQNEKLSGDKINPDDFEEIYDPEKEETTAEETVQISAEEVRGKLAAKSAEGHQSEIRELIRKFGGKKFTDLDASVYPALLKELEVI